MRSSSAMRDDRDTAGDQEADAASTFLTFDLGAQSLGVEVRHVREILDMQKITRLPNAPHDVHGVVDVRGASVPIVDLKSRLGVPPSELGPDARIVVLEVEAGAARQPIGILADRVRNVDLIGDDEIEPAPGAEIGAWDASTLRGLVRRDGDLIVLVDLRKVFGGERRGLPEFC
ncbi:chemotaxis protein CheW [Roseitranquillus sediminis]|uniref:chemotaxis protein CheW n=1 Tax=Roseitranquillus sediminis TaxID=2809051 RepID=UPI001D0C2381|nr:chemotaxis protein CheW [Roseitranquillus sediminis]MBM9593601.1 chemotaxis protein CheW [Roseitranquillus sediminis]